MAYHYSNPNRSTNPHALPDVEVFSAIYSYCPSCNSLVLSDMSRLEYKGAWATSPFICDSAKDCRGPFEPDAATVKTGWFWQSCYPGCLPDGDPNGPFDTDAEALADAQEQE